MKQNHVYEKLFCVTDRHLCDGDFLQQIEKVAALHPPGIILREKDYSEDEYRALALQVKEICDRCDVPLFVHGHVEIAKEIGCNAIHLPYKTFVEYAGTSMHCNEEASLEKTMQTEVAIGNVLGAFEFISVSCHSKEEVVVAEQLGATQIVLGTIFETNCKPGKVGAGLEFLKDICEACSIPVYAIGGVKDSNLDEVLAAGAAGGCMMSGYMKIK